jgi:hypothetical protein
MAVSDKGWEEHETYWSITQVLDARLLDQQLWLSLELKRERSNFKKIAALSLPIDEATWVRDRAGNLSCPKEVPWTKAEGVSPRASVLRDPKEFPDEGQELEVQNR